MFKLNETPVRTSKNFNINNIKINDVIIPENIRSFENVDIINESSKILINNNVNLEKLTYGLNKDLESLNKKANQNINIDINSKSNKNIYINFEFDEDNLDLLDNILITANEDTKATVVIKYKAEENVKVFHNGIIRVVAKSNSNIKVIVINLLNNESNNFMAIENTLEENAKVNYVIVDFGGKNSITNYFSNLMGDSSDNRLNTIYLGKNNQLFDLNYIGELRGEKSNINIEVQGALKDNAKKHFKGTIDFKKGCKKAVGNENEACMLLSENAKSLALPMLLCSEEDVEGNHSTSSGKIGEKELFYIMSRGFEYKEAMKLMVRAKFNKIIDNIKDEELREEILEEIDKRLD